MSIKSRIVKLEAAKGAFKQLCIIRDDDETEEAAIDRYCTEHEIREEARDKYSWFVMTEQEAAF